MEEKCSFLEEPLGKKDFPCWFHHDGTASEIQNLDVKNGYFSFKNDSTYIVVHFNEKMWHLSWQINNGEKNFSGATKLSNKQLAEAFSLAEKFPCEDKYMRWHACLNIYDIPISEMNIGYESENTISILLNKEIENAVKKLLGTE